MYVGHVIAIDHEQKRVQIDVKNRFAVGDKLEIIKPNGNHDIILEEMWDKDGQAIKVAPGAGHVVWARLPVDTDVAYIARYVASDENARLGQIQIVEA